jgi:DNA-3-methyladenine glycosylase
MILATRVNKEFFTRDVLALAPALLGMKLVRTGGKDQSRQFIITETEAYRGEEDLACHASKGRTRRTSVMYRQGGVLYVYLIYGMHWMLNIVCGKEEVPQALLIRGLQGISGPGRVTKALGIDKSFDGEDLELSGRIWLEESGIRPAFEATPRIGIDYSGPVWKNKLWRFVAKGI